MAGPVWSTKAGATGWGAKLVTEWVCAAASAEKKSKNESIGVSTGKPKRKSLFDAFIEWLVTD